MRGNNLILLAYIIALQILDVLTTWLSLESGNIELNPLIRFLGVDKSMILKLGVGALFYYWVVKSSSVKERVELLAFYSVIMLYAVINNIMVSLL
jgi:hypothetical protein